MEERSESRKRIKLEKQALERPTSNPRLNGCQFFVKRKRRFCKLEKVKIILEFSKLILKLKIEVFLDFRQFLNSNFSWPL